MTREEAVSLLANAIGSAVVAGEWSIRDAMAQVYESPPTRGVAMANMRLVDIATSILEAGYLRPATEDDFALDAAVAAPADQERPVPRWKQERGLR